MTSAINLFVFGLGYSASRLARLPAAKFAEKRTEHLARERDADVGREWEAVA